MTPRLLLHVLLTSTVSAFTKLLPGVTPNHFATREPVPLIISQVTSTRTQIPYDAETLPYCHLASKEEKVSKYELLVKVPESCKVLCRKTHTRAEMRLFRALIDNEYRNAWTVDGLPALESRNDAESKTVSVRRGFPVGFVVRGEKETKHFLYNHVRITIHYHEDDRNNVRIVGFQVEPFSIAHDWLSESVLETCNDMSPAAHSASSYQTCSEKAEVAYTYDVFWTQSELQWSQRWDVYLNSETDDEIHYFSIVNSFMIVLFLTGVVAVILLRTLKRDISKYNTTADVGDLDEESGWKLLHGDVFRRPPNAPLLCVFYATGLQLLAVAFSVVAVALLGFASPANRGSLLRASCAAFVVFEALNGYSCARLFAFFQLSSWTTAAKTSSSSSSSSSGGEDVYHHSQTSRRGVSWFPLSFASALFYPATVATVSFVIAVVLAAQGTATLATASAVTAWALASLGVALPLAGAGAYSATFVSRRLEPPVRIAKIRRPLPPQPQWYANPLFAVLFGGVLPFGAVCIELFFVMSALWLEQIYYVFGFLVVVLLILVATCAEMTIVLTYFQLCNEDYRWWWRAFLSSGSAAFYLFAYSVWYFVAKLHIDGTAPACLYFAYMAIIAFTFFLTTGAIGLHAALHFNLAIYAAIKVD